MSAHPHRSWRFTPVIRYQPHVRYYPYTAMNLSKSTASSLRWQAIAALALALVTAPALRALVFEFGDVKGSFDTTVSIGALARVAGQDPNLIGTTNGGLAHSVNGDNGDLNYDRGLASFLLKANHDLQIDYHSMGAFVRGYYFNDFVNSNGVRHHVALSKEAQRLVANGGELLDAYVYFKPTLGDMPASFRIGKQVLSWGESTFIPNGINSINPIDVAKLRTPGSELKEALLPLNMVSGTLSISENLTAEAFYLLDWQRTRIDPPGSYFSTNDFVGKGGTQVFLGFGAIADTSTLGAIPRGTDREPGKSGQWGVNVKYIAHGLNDTEFGAYFMNYSSRLPVISATTPTSPISAALVQSTATSLGIANLLPTLQSVFGPAGGASALNTLLGAALTGVPAAALPASYQPFYPAAASIASGSKTIGLLTAAGTARYIIEFPPDIKLWGASFNTNVKGIAIQGEVSYRQGQPLQGDDVELLFAALSSLTNAVPFGANNQIGNYYNQLNTYIPGWHRFDVWTGQMTATKVGAGILGAQQSTLVAEIGFVDVPSLPSKGLMRYDGSGTNTAGSINEMINTGNGAHGAEPASAFADSFSWGYQLVGKLDYNNFIHGVNMSPLIAFSHDVGGNTPLPLGNFRHDRKTFTIGADFSFQNAWAFEVRYVNFFGAGQYNLLGDRDFVSTTLKYSF